MDLFRQLQAQAQQVEVVHLHSETTSVEFESNRFKTSRVEETRGTAVRVVHNGRLGFSASSDEGASARLMSNVLESAAFGAEVPIAFPPPSPAPQVKVFDPAIVDLTVGHLVEVGQQIVALLLSVEPQARVNVSLSRGLEHTALQNQAGTDTAFRRSPLSIGVEVIRIQGDDVLILYDMLGTTAWEEDLLAFARRLADKFRLARKLTTMRTARMPVLFAPSGSLVLGLPLMEGVDGKNVFAGVSPMAGKVGEALFDRKLTLVDDGTLDGRYGSAPYDDEGVPHRRNVLVDRGVLQGFLYDLKTAAQSGVESTGNGSRTLFTPPRPSPTNLILAAGETPLAEMIAGIDEGLLVEDLLGLGQGNTISGAFSNPIALGFKIEKGEIVGRVKDVSIAGNIYEVLKDVAAISRESEWVFGNFCLPYVLLPEMTVVAKE
jgi:PmbA protein